MAKYYQGLFKPLNPKKYKGNVNQIVYRSSWELKYLSMLDRNDEVLSYSSEEVVIPYKFNGKIRRYFVDMIYTTKQGTFLVEIKPHAQTIAPVITEGKQTKTKLRQVLTWGQNQAKWQAAKKYCELKGWQFIILTEYDLGIKQRK